jgi:hypothetical protein
LSPGIKIDRQELYDLVWLKPVVRIAKDFGISDVAVGKICKKLNIPKPGLGYWAKMQAGKPFRQTPLPPQKPGDPNSYTIKGAMDPNLKLTSELIEKQKTFESTSSNKITVKKTLRKPHPLVEQTLLRKKAYESSSFRELHNLPPGLDMSVSNDSFHRALRIMDALIKALDKRGYEITATSGYGGYTAVTIESEEIKFDIFEFSRKIPNPNKSGRLYPSETILEPTGRLSLRIQNYFVRQKTLSDGKVKKIEDRLNEFMMILVRAAESEKIRRKEREQRDKEYQEEEQKLEEARLIKQREQERLNQLFENADTWNKCVLARQYIEAVRDNSDGDDLEKWAVWANEKVERIASTILSPTCE